MHSAVSLTLAVYDLALEKITGFGSHVVCEFCVVSRVLVWVI